ncbi:hypothetical protein EDD15DRAFT_1649093 [Pisolithus albus]|nr:hypothetical protein EDD15DRAFT_1649093 [Pisolithus albus]
MRRLRAMIRVDVMQKISFIPPHGYTTNSACSFFRSAYDLIQCAYPVNRSPDFTSAPPNLRRASSVCFVSSRQQLPRNVRRMIKLYEQTFGSSLGQGQGPYLILGYTSRPSAVASVTAGGPFIGTFLIFFALHAYHGAEALISWNDADLLGRGWRSCRTTATCVATD